MPASKQRRTRAEIGVRGLDIGKLSQISGASRWATGRAVNGHPVSVKTIQRIAEAGEGSAAGRDRTRGELGGPPAQGQAT